MKKLFTLIAAALLGSAAFAQSEWQNLIVNGNMEDEQDPMWSCFWAHDYRQGVEIAEGSGQQYDTGGQFQGFAEIVEDPADATNHCARVIIRSEAEADEAGNKVTDQGAFASWDCQFLIYATEQIPSGKELRMTLRVKADKPGWMFETQAHQEPGNYNHYQLFGNIDYGTEWQRIQVTASIDGNHTQESNGKWMQSVAFNLSTQAGGNVIYFDDVKLEIRDPKGPSEITGWFDMLRHGTLSNDPIQNYTNFTGRDAADGTDKPCRVVDDPTDGQPALTVAATCWEGSREEQEFEDDGTPKTDDEGNPVYKTVQYWHKADGTEMTAIDDWQAQFFVTVPHKFIPNSKYRLVMWYRADVAADVDTQLHNMPGGYVHWDAIGQLHCTPEWQKLELIEATIPNEGKGCQTIAFNCNKLKDELNNYYFRFEEFSFNEADIAFSERVLGQQNIVLPVPAATKDDGIAVTLNFTECLKKLESDDYQNLVDDAHTAVLQGYTADEEEEFSVLLSSTTGLALNDNGLYDEQGNIILEFDPDGSAEEARITIYNMGTNFEGKQATTKLAYAYGGWYYVFNVTLVDEAQWASGIENIENGKLKMENSVYNMQGQRVGQSSTFNSQSSILKKGLYIMNGRKVVVR